MATEEKCIICEKMSDMSAQRRLSDSRRISACYHALRKAPHWPDMLCITIPKSPYTPRNIHIEGDFSGASYLLAAGALGKRPVSVSGLRHDSLQGEIGRAHV